MTVAAAEAAPPRATGTTGRVTLPTPEARILAPRRRQPSRPCSSVAGTAPSAFHTPDMAPARTASARVASCRAVP